MNLHQCVTLKSSDLRGELLLGYTEKLEELGSNLLLVLGHLVRVMPHGQLPVSAMYRCVS